MTKFLAFGIFEPMVNDLIEELILNKVIIIKGISLSVNTDKSAAALISQREAINSRRQALKGFFYEEGAEAFCNGEFASIKEALAPFLAIEHCFPHCFSSQVLGNKYNALNNMRSAFLGSFMQATERENTQLEDCYDSFMINAINENKEFYPIEAAVRSGLRDYVKNNPNYVPEAIPRFHGHFLDEYIRIAAACEDAGLKQKIEAHIQFSRQAAELAIYTPRSRAIIAPISMPSLSSLTLIPTTQPLLQRSTSSNDQLTYQPSSLFSGFRFSSRDAKPQTTEQAVRPKSM